MGWMITPREDVDEGIIWIFWYDDEPQTLSARTYLRRRVHKKHDRTQRTIEQQNQK